jgi:hypothetical protein
VCAVDQSGAISSGQATVTLRDAANAQVYSGEEVRLTDVTGTLNFRVQKRS